MLLLYGITRLPVRVPPSMHPTSSTVPRSPRIMLPWSLTPLHPNQRMLNSQTPDDHAKSLDLEANRLYRVTCWYMSEDQEQKEKYARALGIVSS